MTQDTVKSMYKCSSEDNDTTISYIKTAFNI